MSVGIGITDSDFELKSLEKPSCKVGEIPIAEFLCRIQKAQSLMRKEGITFCYINAGTNLEYFTGIEWGQSERLLGCIIPANGSVHYLSPKFEYSTIHELIKIPGEVHCWEEDESPYQLFLDILNNLKPEFSKVGIDESTPFFISERLRSTCIDKIFVDAKNITAGCRMQKSKHEIEILQYAKDITLAVQCSAARILHKGISTAEVASFIHAAHELMGAPKGSYFCIVLFGEDTAYPHGVQSPKALEPGDMVLIDTGCEIYGYHSDITRSYVFGEPSARQRIIWNLEKLAQSNAFEAARIGAQCEEVDLAARLTLENAGFGPDYQLPGLPHRTGHGIGLDIHEWPYLVKQDKTILAEGMCFSNEPMICIPGEFGIRLEDHFYMTSTGPCWFTEPSYSIDDPFGYTL